jgi:hypothetical protein
MIRRKLLIVLILSLLAACAPVPQAGDQLPDLEGTWSITLSQSGGFAGVQRTVTITADGKVVAMDARADHRGTLQLSEAELEKLKQHVSAAGVVGPTGTDTGCADCFLYDLKIVTSTSSFSVALDDVTLPESGLEPLITHLRGLMEQALAAQ